MKLAPCSYTDTGRGHAPPLQKLFAHAALAPLDRVRHPWVTPRQSYHCLNRRWSERRASCSCTGRDGAVALCTGRDSAVALLAQGPVQSQWQHPRQTARTRAGRGGGGLVGLRSVAHAHTQIWWKPCKKRDASAESFTISVLIGVAAPTKNAKQLFAWLGQRRAASPPLSNRSSGCHTTTTPSK